MSYLDHFLKESSTRHGGSVESEEGDIEDNRVPSVASSKSNLSELSIVSLLIYINFSFNKLKKYLIFKCQHLCKIVCPIYLTIYYLSFSLRSVR